MLVFLLPMAILLRPGCSAVLSAEYDQAVQETPYIRLRARLPRTLKIKLAILIAMMGAVAFVWDH